MNKILSKFLIVTISLLCTSCANAGNAEKRLEFAKIVESRRTQDLLNDLYLGSDADVQAIARVMNVTPSSIERIRNGETTPTPLFEERIYEVSLYYMQNGRSFSRLRSILDPEYKWFDVLLDAPKDHPWIFWGVTIGLFLFSAAWFFPPLILIGAWGLILEFLLYCVVWIASWIYTPESIQDPYADSINPTIEQIK